MASSVAFQATVAAPAAGHSAQLCMSGHHKRVTTGEEDEDIDPLVNQQGCGKQYAHLETCLADNDRDWRKCQGTVKELQACYQAAKAKGRGKQ